MKLTKRGKNVLVIITIMVLTSILCFSALTGTAEKKDAELNYFFYTVEHDDTIWSIACEHSPENKDVRKTVYEILKLNNITTDELKEGMRLAIFKN